MWTIYSLKYSCELLYCMYIIWQQVVRKEIAIKCISAHCTLHTAHCTLHSQSGFATSHCTANQGLQHHRHWTRTMCAPQTSLRRVFSILAHANILPGLCAQISENQEIVSFNNMLKRDRRWGKWWMYCTLLEIVNVHIVHS